MSVVLSPIWVGNQFVDLNGNLLAGGQIYTYAYNSWTVQQATFTDGGGNTPNTNPIVLNESGIQDTGLWLTEGVCYNYLLTDSNGNTIQIQEDICGYLFVGPGAPNLVPGCGITPSTPTITWTVGTVGTFPLAGYQIWRSLTEVGGYTQIATVSSSTYSYTDSSASPETTYYYYILATDSQGNVSAASATQTCSTFVTIVVTSGSGNFPFSGEWETSGVGYINGGSNGLTGPLGSSSPSPAIVDSTEVEAIGGYGGYGYGNIPSGQVFLLSFVGNTYVPSWTSVIVQKTGGTAHTFLLSAATTEGNPASGESTVFLWDISSLGAVAAFFADGITTTLTFPETPPPTPVIYPSGEPTLETITYQPQVWLRWSDDGGNTWSNWIQETIGGTGQYVQWVKFMQLGQSDGGNRVYHVRYTEPTPFDIIGADIRVTPAFQN